MRRVPFLLGACALLAACSAPRGPAPAAATPQAPAAASAVLPPTASTAVPAPPEAAPQKTFDGWVAAFRADAARAGIDDATLASAFDGVQWLPRVVELDRAQPEFTRTVWDYLDAAVSPQRVALGRERLATWRAAADAATARFGVPAEIVAAIWGVESNFGGNTGGIPTIDALATLGFDGRREAWARTQLMAALRILQRGDIDRAHMLGSWAGAMGQTQFLPSVFLDHAVDADGDGRCDIWGSLPDVLASTAHFLAASGWRAGEPWGAEVVLPPGFDAARADAAVRQPSSRWAEEGVRGAGDAALPPIHEAWLWLPAGVRGPAFLLGPNFRALLRYNASTSYALAVGLLAQRLDSGPGVLAAWPRDEPALSREQVRALQSALNARGFAAGEVDGLPGPATRDAVRRFQQSAGLPADGFATRALVERLQAP